MGTPRVSILIATYNRAAYLPLAIRSVLSQSFGDFELLVLDDASTDHSALVIRELLRDRRVAYVRHPRNLGINANRNAGLALARGEYVAMLDSDDLWIDDSKLKSQVEFLDGRPRCGLVGTFAKLIDERGRVIGDLKPRLDPRSIRRNIMWCNQFVQSSVLIRRSSLDRSGWYDPKIPVWEDYELWLRMGKTCELYNLPDAMTGYRTHATNITKCTEWKGMISNWMIYRRYHEDYPFSSLLWAKACLRTLLYHGKYAVLGQRQKRSA